MRIGKIMATVTVIQHIEPEGPGLIADGLLEHGLDTRVVRVFRGDPVPRAPEGAVGIVVMGGPMGVGDRARYPHLDDEMRLLERTLEQGVPVLGVCLGAQLLAAVLGASVDCGEAPEIGWYPVELAASASEDPLFRDLDSPFTAFHWHGDVFGIPRGATGLASSARTDCQAFRYGDAAFGLLFHLEVTRRSVRGMVEALAVEAQRAGADADAILRDSEVHLPALTPLASAVFGRWAALAMRRSDRSEGVIA